MTCFFDPSHGQGVETVTWRPQWGVPRPVQTCSACAGRVRSLMARAAQRRAQPRPQQPAPPPPGYPQPVYQQPVYGQPVYQQPVYGPYPPQAGYGYGYGYGYSGGEMMAAGAAGFVGGMVVGEMFDDWGHDDVDIYVEEDVDIDMDMDFDEGGDFDDF